MSLTVRTIPALAILSLATPTLAQDLVVPAGSTVVYDTTAGPLRVEPARVLMCSGSLAQSACS